MMAGPVAHPWRRFVRVSVRGLAVVVLVIGVGLGWLVRGARIQRDAVAAIKTAGGWAEYDWEWSKGKSIVGGKPWAPGWLVDLVGVDYFGHVTHAWLLSPSTATDATFAQVGRLTGLENLELFRSSLSDTGVQHLKGLSRLVYLNLGATQISDAGLVHLKGLNSLEYLGLDYTQVTDRGLAHLKGARNLSLLGFSRTLVTDTGINELRQSLPRLAVIRGF